MNLTGKNERTLFASQSLTGHVLRGALGLGLLAFAVSHQSQAPVAVAAAIGALLAMRGCPVCWTIGLVETVAQRRRRRRADSGNAAR